MSAMQTFVITFRLRDMTGDEYRALCDEIAPAFAELPGLLAKIWLAGQPVARATRNAAVEAATRAGWQMSVRVRRSAGPSKQIPERS